MRGVSSRSSPPRPTLLAILDHGRRRPRPVDLRGPGCDCSAAGRANTPRIPTRLTHRTRTNREKRSTSKARS